MAITKTRATSYAGASRGPERRGGGRRTRKPVKEKAALVATVNSVPSSGDGKRIKSEDNEQQSQDVGTVEVQLCCVTVHKGEEMNTTEFRPILARNLKELLPDNTQVWGSLFSNSRSGAEATFIVRFNNRNLWVNWILDGFNENSNRTLERALKLWQTKGPALFEVVTRVEWERRPGWACNSSGDFEPLQTPHHYFQYSEIDYEEDQYGSYYDGLSNVKGFLKEMKLHIEQLDGEPFGYLFF